jgi:hypothetical protein
MVQVLGREFINGETTVSEKWVHIGPGKNSADRLICLFTGMILCTKETIHFTGTGEQREVYVAAGQSIEGAVNGCQFTDLPRNGSDSCLELERL